MRYNDFYQMIQRVLNQGGATDPEARAMLYEEYIRYMAKGGVNSFHANKIARLFMKELDISKVSPK